MRKPPGKGARIVEDDHCRRHHHQPEGGVVPGDVHVVDLHLVADLLLVVVEDDPQQAGDRGEEQAELNDEEAPVGVSQHSIEHRGLQRVLLLDHRPEQQEDAIAGRCNGERGDGSTHGPAGEPQKNPQNRRQPVATPPQHRIDEMVRFENDAEARQRGVEAAGLQVGQIRPMQLVGRDDRLIEIGGFARDDRKLRTVVAFRVRVVVFADVLQRRPPACNRQTTSQTISQQCSIALYR